MKKKILKRTVEKSGMPRILDILGKETSLSDLQSLLLEISARQAGKITPAMLLDHYTTNRFVQPSDIEPRTFLKMDRWAMAALPRGFEVLDLSPLCPLASCSAVAAVHQDRVVTTTRASEVVADATNVLALEAARRRREMQKRDIKSPGKVKLAASHRQVRAQTFTNPKFSAHFKIFTLCTAGRDAGGHAFETQALLEHLGFYVRFLNKALSGGGRRFSYEVLITAMDRGIEETLRRRVLPAFSRRYPDVRIGFWPERNAALGYYSRICFNIRLSGEGIDPFDFMADGGFTDWTQKLLSNRKERLLTSGIGTELLARILAL